MSNKELEDHRKQLTEELCSTYDIKPSEIVFFGDDDRPLIAHEAACVMLNALVADVKSIIVEPVPGRDDAVSMQCSIKLANDKLFSFVGVANFNEMKDEGEVFSEQQIYQMASSRALRGTLRVAGIDLIKLHRGQKVAEFTGSSKDVSPRDLLLREVHALGKEADLIVGNDKVYWQRTLDRRYGFTSSGDLDDHQLADFAGYLKTLVKTNVRIAA